MGLQTVYGVHQGNYQGLLINLGLPIEFFGILAKSLLFGQNGLRKSAWWRPPDSNKNSKIVKTNRQNVYEVHQCNYQGLFINLGLLGGSFWQKVHFFVKIDSGNQPGDIPLILTKNQKLLKSVKNMSLKWAKVIFSDEISIQAI